MKSLVSPLLLVFILLFLALLIVGLTGFRGSVRRRRKRLFLIAGTLVGLLLYSPATLLGSEWLRGSLAAKSRESANEKNAAWQPDWIVVLAGGIVRGATTDENVLSVESALRVGRAVTLTKDYPDAGLVFSGGRCPGTVSRWHRTLSFV